MVKANQEKLTPWLELLKAKLNPAKLTPWLEIQRAQLTQGSTEHREI